MFRFAHPLAFALLVPLLAAAWWVYRRRARRGLLFPLSPRLRDSAPTWRTRGAQVLPLLTLLGIAAAVVALARPQTVLSKVRRTADVIAIQMIVDVSGTMEALDLSERTAAGVRVRTRLEAAKDAFADFVKRRPDDLIGLVTFGGFVTSRVPLTSDHEALLHVLKGVEVPKPAAGQSMSQEELLTAIGDALATGCARLEKAEPKSRIIVLLTDGLSNTGIIQPDVATKMAKTLGIKVYTIGIGTTGNAPFRVKDMFGQDTIQYAEVAMDEPLLKTIASSTGGRYFNVRDPHGLEEVLAKIDDLEKTRVEQDIFSQYNELFPWFLVPGLCLVAIGTGLNLLAARRMI